MSNVLLQLRTSRTLLIEMNQNNTPLFKEVEIAIIECIKRLLAEVD